MKRDFGSIQGKVASLFTLENEHVKIELTDYGARIVSCVLKKNGLDILQGFDDVSGFINDGEYMGATVGRVANRIGKGKFTLNNKEYTLPINNNGNTLHGGPHGYNTQFFDFEEADNKVIFTRISQNLEEGFPGELLLKVTYELLADGFKYITEASSNEDTLCSITNHAFFNMNGSSSDTAMDHEVQIFANQFSVVDSDGLTLPIIKKVEGTPFDFKEAQVIGNKINLEDEDLKAGSGFDHNFILNGTGLKKAVIVKGLAGTMEILTTMPCLQFYSGNFLAGNSKGKNGATFPYRSGICFEPQYFPNAINYDCAEKPILKKNEIMKHITEYRFK